MKKAPNKRPNITTRVTLRKKKTKTEFVKKTNHWQKWKRRTIVLFGYNVIGVPVSAGVVAICNLLPPTLCCAPFFSYLLLYSFK